MHPLAEQLNLQLSVGKPWDFHQNNTLKGITLSMGVHISRRGKDCTWIWGWSEGVTIARQTGNGIEYGQCMLAGAADQKLEYLHARRGLGPRSDIAQDFWHMVGFWNLRHSPRSIAGSVHSLVSLRATRHGAARTRRVRGTARRVRGAARHFAAYAARARSGAH